MSASTGGIAGFHGSGDETLLHALAAALVHRGTGEAVHGDGKAGLAVRAQTPEIATSADGLSAVVDGPPGLADHALALYAQGGVAALGAMTGRFAVAIYDPAADVLVLARDLTGAAPLYYAVREGGVVFASEPGALLAAGALEPAPDNDTIRRFVLTGASDDGEATFFAGVSQVRPGHAVSIGGAGVSPQTQIATPLMLTEPIGVSEAVHDPFRVAARLAERPAVRLGHGLPGAVLAAQAPEPAAVIAASFRPLDATEDAYVDAVFPLVAHGAARHTVEVNSDTLVADLGDLIVALGEPVADLEAYVQYAAARAAAAAGADLLVDPAGAGETFGLPAAQSGKRARKRVEPASLVRIPGAAVSLSAGAGGRPSSGISFAAVHRAADRTSARLGVRVAVPYADPNLAQPADALRAALPAAARAAADVPRPGAPTRDWLMRLKNRIYGVFMEEAFVNRGWFDQQAVMVAFEDFIKGRNADADLFWRIWCVEMWAREFFDPKPAADAEPVRIKGPLEPNAGKQLEITVRGERWIRFPIRTDLFTNGDPYQERITGYVRDLVTAATADGRYAASFDRPWYLLVSEKIVAIAQGRSYFIWDIEPSWWARTLSRFVVRTPYGIGLGSPWTMELALREAGLPRILFASAVSAAGKVVGKRGLFYQVAGHSVRAIDGPTEYSVFPANVSAKLAPAHPHKVAAELVEKVRSALAADGRVALAQSLAGVVVIDANDIGRNVLGQQSDRPDAFFEELFGDNPLGQGSEQTPLAVAVPAPGSD